MYHLSPDPHVTRWIARELAAAPPRAPSLVITVWGDSIAPHGGAVMLPGLIRLLEPFGVNERLTRTSVFRLARERWLSARRMGRRSLYRLTTSGARRFEQAYRRIYAPPADTWDDDWELVIAGGLSARRRLALRDELHWDGFGVLAPGVYARPAQAGNAVSASLAALGARVIVLRARDGGNPVGGTLAASVPHAWDLAGIATGYRKFLRRFGGVIERFRRAPGGNYDPEQCFVVRTLLIHEYRRVLLKATALPPALLPAAWPGHTARGLAAKLYRALQRPALRHAAAIFSNEDGALPAPDAAYCARFGGLPPRVASAA